MSSFHKLIAASSIVLAAVAGATSVASTSVASAIPVSASQSNISASSTTPMRESPVAAFLGHAVISCAQGALASVAIDVLRDVAGGGDAPKYVEDAVISCIFGAGVGVAWKALTPAVKKKVISAVVAVVIGVSPLD
ncbi:hypothetical protein [Nocardia asiatica]|uniref:hypothetical protein n=1 Tax=Nocardia asiatica TaxID=209252 RepID=UPI002456E3B4|nr:hypothetical protein [Nocardia asiatica]